MVLHKYSRVLKASSPCLSLSSFFLFFVCVLYFLRCSEHANYNDVCYTYTIYCLHVMEDTKVPSVKEFKYLGSTVQESGSCEREVKKRVQTGWNGWRRVSGVICNRRLPARVKEKVYSSVVRPAMVYELEGLAGTKKQVKEMEVAEMKMLRFAMGVTRKYKIRNKHIRSTVKVERLGMKMREGRLRWYGHVMRRDQEYVRRKMIEMELQGKRKRGRPKGRFLDVVKEDMRNVGAKETDVEDRTVWRKMIRCGYP